MNAHAARGAGPSDADIEGTIMSSSPAARRELVEAITSMVAELGSCPHLEWTGPSGEPVPYPIYSESVRRLIQALTAVGALPTFDWMHWGRLHMTIDELGQASLADVARWLHALVRSERYGDGKIAWALEGGELLTAARRVAAAIGNEP